MINTYWIDNRAAWWSAITEQVLGWLIVLFSGLMFGSLLESMGIL
jgi:hypothetical protein